MLSDVRAKLTHQPAGVKTPPPPPIDPYGLLKKPDVGLVQITGDGDVVAYVDGKAVDDNGNAVKTDDTMMEKLKKSFPDPRDVTPDYMTYRKWRGVSNIGVNALNYLGTAATAAGLVAAAGMHIPILALLGTGAVAAYFMKSALNPIGTWLGGNAGKKIEDDPANWMSKSFIVQAAGNAVQAVTLAVPMGFFALVPTTNAAVNYGSTTQATADTIVQNHQALRGLGSIPGKNKKQDLATSGIGTLLGVGAAIALAAAFGPLAPLYAAPPFLALSIWGAVMSAKSLKFDNLTNGVVRSLVHQELESGKVLNPDELKKEGRKLPKKGLGIDLGADATALQADPQRFNQLKSQYGNENYLLDITGEGKKAEISVVLNNEASERDAVKAVYQAQVLSEIMGSAGYQTLKAKLGDDKAASLKAIELSAGVVQNFDDIMKGIEEKNWDMARTMMITGSDRSLWQRNPEAPKVAPLTIQQIQGFMKTGEVPPAEEPQAKAEPQPAV